MKKKSLAALALLAGLSLYSCSDEPKSVSPVLSENPSVLVTTNPLDSIGRIHNEIVDYYKCVYETRVTNRFFYYQGVSYVTEAAYQNMIAAITDYTTNTLGWAPSAVQNMINSVYSFNAAMGLNATINGQNYVKIVKDFRAAATYSFNQGNMDAESYAVAMRIYDGSTTPGFVCDMPQVIDSLEASHTAAGWQNPRLAAFIATYRHSEDLWASPIITPIGEQPCGLSPGSAVAIADAGGTLVGMIWGGLASPALCYLASICESEDQARHNSVLVGSEYPESRFYKKKPHQP